jgi:hypothetical protein
MHKLLQDLRYAVRTLLKGKGFTLVAIVTPGARFSKYKANDAATAGVLPTGPTRDEGRSPGGAALRVIWSG